MKIKSMIQSRKGAVNFNKSINTGIVIVVSIVILLSIWAALVPEAQTAGDTMNDSNRCSAVGCHYNDTWVTLGGGEACVVNASNEANATACTGNDEIPLSSLFGGNGIIILMLMVLALIVGLRIVLPKGKK